ncbi:hypothetical protein BDV97DRAFT_343774 [Delphinella strobiligena]|nr:hypothetical protein BDV97DRAFT_343774 [Delphinella strobiligena]
MADNARDRTRVSTGRLQKVLLKPRIFATTMRAIILPGATNGAFNRLCQTAFMLYRWLAPYLFLLSCSTIYRCGNTKTKRTSIHLVASARHVTFLPYVSSFLSLRSNAQTSAGR